VKEYTFQGGDDWKRLLLDDDDADTGTSSQQNQQQQAASAARFEQLQLTDTNVTLAVAVALTMVDPIMYSSISHPRKAICKGNILLICSAAGDGNNIQCVGRAADPETAAYL